MSDPRRWLDPTSDAPEAARELLRRAPTPPPMSADAKARIAKQLASAAAPSVGTARWKLLFGAGVIGLAALGLVAIRMRPTRATPANAPIAQSPAHGSTPAAIAARAPSMETPRDDEAPTPPTIAIAPPPVAPAPGPRATQNNAHVAAHGSPVDELALLQRASRMLDRDPRGALESVREHEARFPRGQFVEERESIAVRALVAAGRTGTARERGLRFLRRFPSSIYAPRVRSIVTATP